MKNHTNPARHCIGLKLSLIGLISAIMLVLCPAKLASAEAVAPSWNYTGNLNTARHRHTATLLPDGRVLVAGGHDFDNPALSSGLNSAELYDPKTGIWSTTGNLNTGRYYHAAALLPNGKVLVVGGNGARGISLTSAELYDPTTGTWSSAGHLSTAHSGYSATLLPNGTVLVVGNDGAEVYDPATGIWGVTGHPHRADGNSTATLLQSGKVLVAGGENNANSAELYDPATGTWSVTGNLSIDRSYFHTATLLQSGKVLVAGDYDGGGAELYDPATGTCSNTSNPNTDRSAHSATLLTNGKVLVAGGVYCASEEGCGVPNSTELYDPTTGTWSITASLNLAYRTEHTATLLTNGKVLVVGGQGGPGTLNSAELYDPGISSTPNVIDDTPFFVRQHYRDFLNREADPDGLNFWTGEIFMCGSDTQCIEAKRINVSASFFLSIEFQESGYLVYRFHKSAFGNLAGAPVPVRFADFLTDDQQLGQGVIVNQTGWQTVLENNKQAYANGFVQRSQFTSAFPTSMSPATFVDALFLNAGVTPTSADRTAAINEFSGASTTTDVAARARAVRRVAENTTFASQEFNRAFVLMQYFGYLRRNPNDAPDGNFDGYNFWLTKLNQFNGNYIQAEMVKAFLSSIEYRRRFGP